MKRTTPFATGFAYPECPRWHAGSLWFSDQHAGHVVRVEQDGTASVAHTIVQRPSGLGWRPDGTLLLVSMLDHRLLAATGGANLQEVASFEGLHQGPTNDMVVDISGRAYIGNIGFDFYAGEAGRTTILTMVDIDDTVSVVADDLLVPNGMVITPDRELIVAESWRHCLTMFDITADGQLTNRRLFADLGEAIPDGICLDATGAVWYASLHKQCEVVRVAAGGEVLDRVSTGDGEAVACALGGMDGGTLYVCVTDHLRPEESTQHLSGRIEAIDVDVASS